MSYQGTVWGKCTVKSSRPWHFRKTWCSVWPHVRSKPKRQYSLPMAPGGFSPDIGVNDPFSEWTQVYDQHSIKLHIKNHIWIQLKRIEKISNTWGQHLRPTIGSSSQRISPWICKKKQCPEPRRGPTCGRRREALLVNNSNMLQFLKSWICLRHPGKMKKIIPKWLFNHIGKIKNHLI